MWGPAETGEVRGPCVRPVPRPRQDCSKTLGNPRFGDVGTTVPARVLHTSIWDLAGASVKPCPLDVRAPRIGYRLRLAIS